MAQMNASIKSGADTLVNQGGSLKIASDNDKLAAYDAWLEANGRGGAYDDAFGQKTVDLANTEPGAFTRTVDRYGPDR